MVWPLAAVGAAIGLYAGAQAILPANGAAQLQAGFDPAPSSAAAQDTAAVLASLPTRAATPDLTAPPSIAQIETAVAEALVTTPAAAEPLPLPETAAAPLPEPEPQPMATLPDTTCIDDLRVMAADTRVYYPSGGTAGEDQGLAQARLIGMIAQDCPGVTVIVEGHSDPSGDPAINQVLSEQRAQTVVDRLSAAGLDTAAFRAVGMGDQYPSAIRGAEGDAYYDRRVEFTIVETSTTAATPARPLPGTGLASAALPACALQLQDSTARTHVYYRPRSVTVGQDDLAAVTQLAASVASCPGARLRVIGQFENAQGSGETPATGRMRAIAMMSTLVAMGFESDMVIMAAPSRPTDLQGIGISNRRLDFDVIWTGE